MSRDTDLEATLQNLGVADGKLRLKLSLKNNADRAIHYIAAPRSYNFDAATSKLIVHLTDEHLPLLHHGFRTHPKFRYLDPGANAEVTVSVPQTLNVLAQPAIPGERVGITAMNVGAATDIELQIAWSDTPYYEDGGRDPTSKTSSVVRWQKHVLKLQCGSS